MSSNGADAAGVPELDSPGAARGGSWMALALMVIAAAVVGGLVGAAAGYGAARLRPSSYQGTVVVRSPTVDGSCVYFNCPTGTPGPNGIPYVADQAQQIPTPAVAQQVKAVGGANLPPIAELVGHVKAAEIGSSNSIAIAYSSPNAAEARQVTADFARGYTKWSDLQAVSSITKVLKVLRSQELVAASNNQPTSQLRKAIQELGAASTVFSAGAGPNGANSFGATPATVVVKRTGLSPVRAAGVGAFIGSIIGVLILLLLLSRSSANTPTAATTTSTRQSRTPGVPQALREP
jgi:hypothetical protein